MFIELYNPLIVVSRSAFISDLASIDKVILQLKITRR